MTGERSQATFGNRALKNGLLARGFLAIFVLLGLLGFLPGNAQAAECPAAPFSAGGYFFQNFESVEYSPEGHPIQHLKVNYTDGRSFKLVWSFYDDECNSASVTGNQITVSLPPGVSDWSVRVVSPTRIEVWNDQNSTVVTGFNIPAYPAYTSIAFGGIIDGGASTFSGRKLKINQNSEAPAYTGTLPLPESCSPSLAGSAGGSSAYFFGAYEHAEYVDGLLRVHLRLKTPYNDGRSFRSSIATGDENCVMASGVFSPIGTAITPRVRYFSFRMISETDWQLWDDESNQPLTCAICSSTLPAGAKYVQWFGSIDGSASTIITTPFSPLEPGPAYAECCSSVVFLPGIQGSRLYEGNEKLWEPLGDEDMQALYLDESGQSIHPDIYSTDVVDTVPITGNRIYQSFLNDLNKKKTDGVIADYAAVPYDWRLSLPEILASGKEEAGGAIFYNRATSTPYIEQTLRRLARNSQTGKVTIVAHSNGGLLAKALVNELGEDANQLVDQLILVGVPQLGTPQAIGALLHGFDTGLPFDWLPLLVAPERARDFARNAPMTYQLLPHSDYYNNAGTTVTTPLISFEPGEGTQAFIDQYGLVIGNNTELRQFITGAEGRAIPSYGDLESPAVGNGALFDSTNTLMEKIGSSWQPPAGIMVHQIAGVGEDTLAGITYKTIRKCARFVVLSGGYAACLEYQPVVSYVPNEVIDGDGTVVTPSALAMSDVSENVKRWWVNLDDYNDIERPYGNIPGLNFLRTSHGNILEIEMLRTFVFENLLFTSSSLLPRYIVDSQPVTTSENRLRFVLHSPLKLSAVDQHGNVISNNLSEVPGATFKQYGGVQVVTIPSDALPTVLLVGIDDGSFTLEVEEYAGDAIIATTTFSGIPSLTGTKASMSFPDGTISEAGELNLDYDGDGAIDITLAPIQNEEVRLPKILLTVSANSKTIVLGNPLPSLDGSISGFPGGETLETSDITGNSECTTTATNTSPAGAYPIVCTVSTLHSNYYSFETFVPGILTIAYSWVGFNQPIDDPLAQSGATPSVFKGGSTVPVKFKLKDVNGNVVQAPALPLWLAPVKLSPLNAPVDESVYTTSPTSGNTFRYDSTSGQYIYNWSTKGLVAGYWYRISAQLDDGTIKSVIVGLR